jgi:hypothetical protein
MGKAMNKVERKKRHLRWLESLPEYPAVLVPVAEGGFEVIFPNFPRLKAYGVKQETAELAAREILTAELLERLFQGDEPPTASDPARLVAGDDEPPGTRLVMVGPDQAALRRRLGLQSEDRGKALKAFGLYGR